MKHYSSDDYDKVFEFLIELTRENSYHSNWNWARFKWMIGHPYTKLDTIDSIGLWYIKGTNYAYLEPVYTIPEHRGKSIAKAFITK